MTDQNHDYQDRHHGNTAAEAAVYKYYKRFRVRSADDEEAIKNNQYIFLGGK
jgi:hypothetical protein